MNSHLRIILTKDISPPSEDYNLLVAFRFADKPDDEDHPAVADTRLRPLGHDTLYECWWIVEPVTYREVGEIRIAECADYAVVIQEYGGTPGEDLASLTHRAYQDLVAAVRSTDHKQLTKAWNYIGGINDGDGDRERYRQFSIGRAAALSELKISDELSPTGTGVGTCQDFGLTIIALASKHPLDLTENPRQVSAFQYPQQYGPASPKFSRGGLVSSDRHKLYLLSGTAAIVGHESQYPFDVGSQLDEILRNLAALNESVSILSKISALRVYLRNPEDLGVVSEKLDAELDHSSDRVVYLHGNICRRELVIEVDGVTVQ